MCSRRPNLEKKLSDMKTEKETLKTKIIQLKFKQEEDKKTKNLEEKRRKEENIQLGLFNWSRVSWYWTISESLSVIPMTTFVS